MVLSLALIPGSCLAARLAKGGWGESEKGNTVVHAAAGVVRNGMMDGGAVLSNVLYLLDSILYARDRRLCFLLNFNAK